MKNTSQSRDDSAHQRTLQKTSTPLLWNGAGTLALPSSMPKGKTVGYFPFPHQLCSIVSERPSSKNCITQEPVHRFVSLINLLETGTLTCLESRWAGLYMLWLFMLDGIFERTVRLWFSEIFWYHCHPQCQICFGLGNSQDTEGFFDTGLSLGCSHYFYTKVCSQMTSGGDLCHVGLIFIFFSINVESYNI